MNTAFCLSFFETDFKKNIYLEIYLEIQNLENLSDSKALISSKLVSKIRYEIWIAMGLFTLQNRFYLMLTINYMNPSSCCHNQGLLKLLWMVYSEGKV